MRTVTRKLHQEIYRQPTVLPTVRPTVRPTVQLTVQITVRLAAGLLAWLLGSLLGPTAAQATVTAVPATVTLNAGETSPAIRLTLGFRATPNGGASTVDAALPAPLVGNTSLEPSPLSYGAAAGTSTATLSFRLRTTAATPAGTWAIALRDRTLGAGSGTVTLIVRRPTVRLRLVPDTLTLTAGGEPGSLTLVTEVETGFTEILEVSFQGTPAGVTPPAPRTLLPPLYGAERVSLSAAENATAGLYPVTVVGRAGGRTLTTTTLSLRILPPAPIIDAVRPQRLLAGARDATVRLMGRHFEAGAQLLLEEAGAMGSVRVLSPRLAEVRLTLPASARPRRLALHLRNPSGATTRQPGLVTVLPPASLAAPLAVTAAAIVFPRPGALISREESLRPQALLATAGSGTVRGSWLLDGVPFEHFAVTAAGGGPVRVEARSAVPHRLLGRHDLRLRIDGLGEAPSPAISFFETREKASELRLLPALTTAEGGPVLSWSLVPGAVAYGVEIQVEGRPRPFEVTTADSALELSPALGAQLRGLGRRWRVRPIYAGGGGGEATPWAPLSLPAETGVLPAESHYAAPRPAQKSLSPLFFHREMGGENPAAESTVPVDASFEAEAVVQDSFGKENPAPATGTLTLSGQLLRETERGQLKATVETAFFRQLEARTEDTEDGLQAESWLAQGRWQMSPEGAFAVDVQAGYGSPRFLASLQSLDGGLATGGGEARLELPGSLAVAAYQSFDPSSSAAAQGLADPAPSLTAAALTLGGPEARGELRLLGLEAAGGDEGPGLPPEEDHQLLGFFGRLSLGASASLEVEAACGWQPGDPDLEEAFAESQTDALRLGLDGSLGRLSYRFALRRTEAGYANPLSQDFSAAGPADRQSLELGLSRPLGPLAVDLQLRQEEGGDGFGPPGTLRFGELGLSATTEGGFSFNLAASQTTTETDEDEELLLPATERVQRALRLSLSKSWGGFQISQQASWERAEDKTEGEGAVTTTQLALNAGGPWGEHFQLAWSASGSRQQGDPFLGVSEQWTTTLQPTWEIPDTFLRLAPVLVYGHQRIPLLEVDEITEDAQLILGWEPPWLDSLLALELGGRWSRQRSAAAGDSPWQRQLAVSLTLSWGAEGSLPRPGGMGGAALRRPR